MARSSEKSYVRFEQYKKEDQLPLIQALIDTDLSEPYSVFTYRYFLNQWPQFSFLAMDGDDCVGCIVCKLEKSANNVLRGYIAMLAVRKDRRKCGRHAISIRSWICSTFPERQNELGPTRKSPLKKGLGSELVCTALQRMKESGCEEVVLEAEESNRGALRLYGNLGFIRAKRLEKYYLNGSDAFRLKMTL
mmetsp:Transcript_25355/g.100107  ORF Transcript_25355/g.100107 Transcript_25355/m.100107 type:complete len:191 (+) Transcript_25355:272-844(+)